MQYMNEFLTIALVHLVAVASPGPDFAVVVRNSVAYGRRIAIYTSIGIGLAILLHVAYSLVGLSVVIATTPWFYLFLGFFGGQIFAQCTTRRREPFSLECLILQRD